MNGSLKELHETRSTLSSQKIHLQGELSELNSRVRGKRIHPMEYQKVSSRQTQIKSLISEHEKRIVELNQQIASKHFAGLGGANDGNDRLQALIALRNEYQAFAADKTRVGSMRQMAAEFVLKLNPIIKKTISES
jgi:DNA repair ATPase RecN